MEERSEMYARTQEAGKAAEEVSERAGQRARAASERIGEGARQLTENISEYVDKHPYKALGIAAAAGFILNALLRR